MDHRWPAADVRLPHIPSASCWRCRDTSLSQLMCGKAKWGAAFAHSEKDYQQRWLDSSSQRSRDAQVVFDPADPLSFLYKHTDRIVLVSRNDEPPKLDDPVAHSE